jgi:perosamine synthetase
MRNEPGAPPSAGFVPLCVPVVRGHEWDYVKECLDTGWVSSVGSYVDRFERELAARAGTTQAVAVVNGTSALHIAMLVAGVQPDDEVLVSTLTFIAPANAIRYANAWPVFIDAEPDYWQMDPARVVEFLRERCERRDGVLRNRKTGRRVKAIIPVHILGHPVDLDPILALAREFNLAVIEDATESLGGSYRGRPLGQIGDLACFSFNGNKIITTGGGGMITTDNADFAKKAKYLTTQAKDDPLEYEHSEIGYNYRLTNIQAAMGCAQLEQLDAYIAHKRAIAAAYTAALADLPGITCMTSAPWAESIFWMFTIRIDAAAFGMDSRALLRRLDAEKIQTRPLWQPMHRSGAHAGAEVVGGEVADLLHRECLSLPCSADLSEAQRDRVIAAIRAAQLASAGPASVR